MGVKRMGVPFRNGGDVVEGDAGAGEGVLDVVGDLVGVSVGGDGDGASVAGGGEGGAHVLDDELRVAAAWDAAILDVPPHRRLGCRVLPHRRQTLAGPLRISPSQRCGSLRGFCELRIELRRRRP